MKKIYSLNLINQNPCLNLLEKKFEIESTIKEILGGGKSKKSYQDVQNIKIVSIAKYSIILEVEETGTNWHKAVGKILASDYSMREYCNPEDTSQMFRWK